MFVITGGGSGLGKALALSLAAHNKEVLIIGRREQLLLETASSSANIHYLCADIATSEGLLAVETHLHSTPKLQALINNAGTLNPLAPLQKIDPVAWQNALNINLNAALYLPQRLYSKLESGRVLNIGTGAAYFAINGWGAYCVSKAALSMLTKCWQLESSSIAFASVLPGIIDTEMQNIARSEANPDTQQVHFYKQLQKDGRLVSPETSAAFLTWLLLDVDKQDYVAQEWDIYSKQHHIKWLNPPHQVIHWED